MSLAYIDRDLLAVREAIEGAAAKSGRDSAVTLLAAVKYATDEELSYLLSRGVRHVGENRVQQLLAHWEILRESGAEVHFIGSLQKNKVKYIIDKVAMIHSVDSVSLALEIERRAAACGREMPVLAELNMAGEESKSGTLPQDAAALCREILSCPHLRLRGFMTMGPRFESEQEYRRYFANTRTFALSLWSELGLEGAPLLSMGMSESFVPAVLEGADIVRVGRGLFLGREEPPATEEQK